MTNLLTEAQGKEIGKKRPALIISDDVFNSSSEMVIILPLSSQLPPSIGFDKILLLKNESKLDKNSIILVDHIRSIDKSRLSKKISTLPTKKIIEIEQALKLVLGFLSE